MSLSPANLPDALLISALIGKAGLTGLQQHLLDALRANAHGAPQVRADGSTWRAVTLADADLDGFGRRGAHHFAALRTAGLFEPAGIAGGVVLISHAAEVLR